jgi:hypothetical protein
LITAFNNIVQIRYSKNPQNYSEKDYNELINICLKTILSILKSIFEICEISYPTLKNSLNNEINISRLSFGSDNTKFKNPFNYTQLPVETSNDIDSNLKKKYELQTASTKFNTKIKTGLAYLKSIGYIDTKSIDTEAKDIALFFRNTPFL